MLAFFVYLRHYFSTQYNMPPAMKMQLGTPSQVPYRLATATAAATPTSWALNGSMIARIHATKPGCSSCGKKRGI
jgi:hypothetical protein